MGAKLAKISGGINASLKDNVQIGTETMEISYQFIGKPVSENENWFETIKKNPSAMIGRVEEITTVLPIKDEERRANVARAVSEYITAAGKKLVSFAGACCNKKKACAIY